MLRQWFRIRRSLRVIVQLARGEVKTSYAQEGEDRVLSRYFGSQLNGFYVDVGAYHPTIFSNTALFYERGWRGINIDCRPGFLQLFDRMRPRDRNVSCAVGMTAGEADYHIVGEGLKATMNTLDAQRASTIADGDVKVMRVSIRPLSEILGEYLNEGQIVDFMSVDVEGMDLEVLRSNNFSTFRPRLILVETGGDPQAVEYDDAINDFLQGEGYAPVAKTGLTEFFEDQQQDNNENDR